MSKNAITFTYWAAALLIILFAINVRNQRAQIRQLQNAVLTLGTASIQMQDEIKTNQELAELRNEQLQESAMDKEAE